MTNDKDSAMLVEDFEIIVGSKHHETKVSQSELLRLINGGAKIHHIKALRQPAQSDVLKAAADAISGLLDITSEYNLSSEQAGRAYAALHDIDAALQEQSK
jgi:hypothetical protein